MVLSIFTKLFFGRAFCLRLISEKKKVYGSLPLLYSAEKKPTTSPIQPEEKSKALQSEHENTNRPAVTVTNKTMQHHQPVKSEGKTENMRLQHKTGC